MAENVSPLPFGVPALDMLLGYPNLEAKDLIDCLDVTTSLAIVGHDGTGKSVFALHLAAAYHAVRHHNNQILLGKKCTVDDPPREGKHKQPMVFYVSSDLRAAAAIRVWKGFYLDEPWIRYVPFISGKEVDFRRDVIDGWYDGLTVALESRAPEEAATTVLSPATSAGNNGTVYFLDLADRTTGDDWLFVTRLIASVGRKPGAAPNLIIVDSIAGFETLVGEKNSFGETMARRARISQLIRAAGNNWHTVFVVEEPPPGMHNPEEYVTDTVLHLRRESEGEKVRRTLEIEKSRSRSFASGVHPFEIRDGLGSSTGSWENPDDPRTFRRPKQRLKDDRRDYDCYIQVFPSLNYLSKDLAGKTAWVVGRELAGDKRREIPNNSFGIAYLDEMLAMPDSRNRRGLPEGSVTSLIGDEGTLKSSLAEEFLIEGFSYFPKLLAFLLERVDVYLSRIGTPNSADINDFLRATTQAEVDTLPADLRPRVANQLREWLVRYESRAKLLSNLFSQTDSYVLRDESQLENAVLEWGREPNTPAQDWTRRPLVPRWDHELYYETGKQRDEIERRLLLALAILRISRGLVAPCIYIATHDISSEKIVARILNRQQGDLCTILSLNGMPPKLWDALARLIERFVIVRRVDLTDATGPQLWHVIHGCVNEALHLIGTEPSFFDVRLDPKAPITEKFQGAIRVVVNDLRLIRDTYPSVNSDPLFLPTMVFRLRRLGVTSLILDSENGRPDAMPASAMNGALRSMVDHQIYTWKVPFFGEERIAISAIPPFPGNAAGIIRELKFDNTATPPRIVVDPRFSLYAGVEEGRPCPVPLEIVLYAETNAFDEYVRNEQGLFGQVFSANQQTSGVIRVEGTRDYERLRDYCHLSVETRLPYTLIFAVDEFWGLSRNSALRKEWSYLYTALAAPKSGSQTEDYIDSFGLFQGTRQTTRDIETRSDAFRQSRDADQSPATSYDSLLPPADSDQSSSERIDRVPFMWDFAFLLLNEQQWKNAQEVSLPNLGVKVGRVRQDLLARRPLSWRQFFGACAAVAQTESRKVETHSIAFDLATATPESLSCCLLEIWLSEIAKDAESLRESNHAAGRDWSARAFELLEEVAAPNRWTESVNETYLQDLLNPEWPSRSLQDVYIEERKRARASGTPRAFADLLNSLPGYSIQLYKVWLLLLEVLDFNKYQDPDRAFELKADYQPTSSAAASRHWYKTACAATSNLDSFRAQDGTLSGKLPVRLPGRFSIRGDWFLGVAKGSRSHCLADRALDLLTSRRANRARLHLGLGLPVRDILEGPNLRRIRTRLFELIPGQGLRPKDYGELLDLGATFSPLAGAEPLPDFCWAFRSAFHQFDRQSRAIQKWIHRMLAWTVQYRDRNRTDWRINPGFDAYDDIEKGNLTLAASFSSFTEFAAGIDVFIDDLNAATLRNSRRGS